MPGRASMGLFLGYQGNSGGLPIKRGLSLILLIFPQSLAPEIIERCSDNSDRYFILFR